jgi:hypothetical protein
MGKFHTAFAAAAMVIGTFASTALGADKPNPGGTSPGRDTPNLGDPQKLGACVQAAKETEKPVIVIEAETLLGAGKVKVNGGNLAVQPMAGFGPGWGGDAQLFWSGGAVGSELDATVFLPNGGVFDGYVHLTQAPDYGKVEAQLTSGTGYITKGVPIDGWGPAVKPPRYWVPLTGSSGFLLQAGESKLSVKITGKNEKSSGYFVGIDCIALRRRKMF